MDILTTEQFTALAPGQRRNYALKKGGSLDVGIADGKVIVGSARQLSTEQLTEAAAIVEDFIKRQAKLAKEKAIDAPQEGRAVQPKEEGK